MEFIDLFNLQLMMFSILAVGYLLGKNHMVTEEGRKVLIDLIINIILPCNIISSFLVEFTREILIQGVEIFLISCLIEVVSTVIALYLYQHISKGKRMILQYGTICSNAGFLGGPIAEGIYGSMGLLYGSIYLIPQRIAMWTVGVSFFTEGTSKKAVIKKVMTHPCMIAVYIGLFFTIPQVVLPVFLDNTIHTIGNCTTALTMLMIGTILAEADLKSMTTKMTLKFSAVRVILLPLLTLIGCYLANTDPVLTGISVILVAMPAGTTTVIFAVKYDGDEEFATKCVVLTTLLSMVMIPIWYEIVNYVMPM